MKLRFDPTANALMAGAFTKSNAGKLAGRLGRDATEGELYIAHFLGATGASRLIGLADTQPTMSAAAVFPGAAHANPTIFYDGRGNARSAADVYHMLVSRYDNARGAGAAAQHAGRRRRRAAAPRHRVLARHRRPDRDLRGRGPAVAGSPGGRHRADVPWPVPIERQARSRWRRWSIRFGARCRSPTPRRRPSQRRSQRRCPHPPRRLALRRRPAPSSACSRTSRPMPARCSAAGSDGTEVVNVSKDLC